MVAFRSTCWCFKHESLHFPVTVKLAVGFEQREAEIALAAAVEGCVRGARSTAEQRATIEEAQVNTASIFLLAYSVVGFVVISMKSAGLLGEVE